MINNSSTRTQEISSKCKKAQRQWIQVKFAKGIVTKFYKNQYLICIIVHITNSRDSCVIFWYRCFVKDNKLIAVSQRDTQVFYEELVANLPTFKPLIVDFFEEQIKGKFLNTTFVFDVYIDIPPNNKVWLIDFNPWLAKTDSALFEWNEVSYQIIWEESI